MSNDCFRNQSTAQIKFILMMTLVYSQADYCEENADDACTQDMVKLQSLQPDPESSAQDGSQYAAIYQALDPKTLDWAGFILFLCSLLFILN